MISPESDVKQKLRRVKLIGTPTSEFKVPRSTGYSVYSALLNVISDSNEDVGQYVHDNQISSLNCSELQGRLYNTKQPHKQFVDSSNTYTITIGITDPADENVFKTLLDTLMLDGEICLTNGSIAIDSLESDNTTHEEILEDVSQTEPQGVVITFEECTSIEEAGSVTTAFPHRWSVFNNLAGKWNASCSDDTMHIDLTQNAVLEHVYEQPDTNSYDTHSKLSSRGSKNGEVRNVKRQGFSGKCTYKFKDASDSIKNAITALSKFGHYSGVGSAVARGFGSISVEVIE